MRMLAYCLAVMSGSEYTVLLYIAMLDFNPQITQIKFSVF